MGRRDDLQDIFEEILPHVYFQPPASVEMVYPAIVYRRVAADTKYADNRPYSIAQQYDVTLICREPDRDALWEKLSVLPTVRHERFFVADHLNHDVFAIYY